MMLNKTAMTGTFAILPTKIHCEGVDYRKGVLNKDNICT